MRPERSRFRCRFASLGRRPSVRHCPSTQGRLGRLGGAQQAMRVLAT